MGVTGARSYDEVLVALFSVRFAALLTAVLVFACFGMTCGYFVFAAQLLQQLLQVAGAPPALRQWWLVIIASAIFPVFPLSLYRNLSDFRYLSLVTITGLAYLTLLVVFRSPHYAASSGLEPGWLWRLENPLQVPLALALCYWSYTVHMNVFACYDELQCPSSQRIIKVLWRSVCIQTVLYASVSFFGFISFGAHTPDNILRAYDESDFFANLGRMFVSLQLVVVIPLTVHPGRNYFWKLVRMARTSGSPSPSSSHGCVAQGQGAIFSSERAAPLMELGPIAGGDANTSASANAGRARAESGETLMALLAEQRIPTLPHILITSGFIGLCALVAVLVPSAKDLMGIVGGFAAVTYIFLLPAQMAVRLRSESQYFEALQSSAAAFLPGKRGLLVIWGLRVASLLGYIAAAQSAWNILRSYLG